MNARYTIRAEGNRPAAMTASADNIDGALDAAWRLQRYTEGPVLILDHDPDGEGWRAQGVAVARVNVDWLD